MKNWHCVSFSIVFGFRKIILLLQYPVQPWALANGQVKCTGSSLQNGEYPVDTTVHFECDHGYDLVGASSSTCQTSGLWSPQPPMCNQGNEETMLRDCCVAWNNVGSVQMKNLANTPL